MKRTIILLISTIFLLAACNNNQKDNQSDKDESGSKNSQNTNQVKQIATDKNVQGDNYRTIYLLKKAKREVSCKIIWQIAITVKILKVAY